MKTERKVDFRKNEEKMRYNVNRFTPPVMHVAEIGRIVKKDCLIVTIEVDRLATN